MLADEFEQFCSNIEEINLDEINISLDQIAKKLNKKYYDIDSETENLYVVGSLGRETATKNISDIDVIFDLPKDVYKRFDEHETNGQSHLLAEVKEVLQERYPNTEIRGDGQVVVISFSKFEVELNPAFKQSDGSFKYPNSHNGGSWKTTNPIPEIDECKKMNDVTNNNFSNFCRILRAWKNNIGFKFKGLLIDTLVNNFLNENEDFKTIKYEEYFYVIKELFNYLRKENRQQSYWYALGSNQQITNDDNGKFVSKANEAFEALEEIKNETKNKNDKMREIFGKEFPKENIDENLTDYADTEQYIEDYYNCKIKYELEIDATITQDGFRPFNLREALKNKFFKIKHDKKIEFKIVNIADFERFKPYNIIWKVKNQGEVAKKRNCIRGKLLKTNQETRMEKSDFFGPHYVEAYLVKDDTCFAKGRISVPIE